MMNGQVSSSIEIDGGVNVVAAVSKVIRSRMRRQNVGHVAGASLASFVEV